MNNPCMYCKPESTKPLFEIFTKTQNRLLKYVTDFCDETYTFYIQDKEIKKGSEHHSYTGTACKINFCPMCGRKLESEG